MKSGRRGLLFVVSAPSGAGKTTLCREMVSLIPNLDYSISYTTRPIRPREKHGKDYYFIDRNEFEQSIERGEFAEWAEVHGHLYGTHQGILEKNMEQGRDIILDVDAQGAALLKARFKEGIFIYILPPSLSALKDRLYEREADSAEEIERRLNQARKEIETIDQYSYRIVNDDFKQASRELEFVICAERLRLRHPEKQWIKLTLLNNQSVT